MITPKILRVLRFLRVTDEQDNLSLTNIALIAAAIHLLTQPGVQVADLLAFAATLAGYQVKRFLTGAAPSPDADAAELRTAMAELESKLAALQVGRVLKPGK